MAETAETPKPAPVPKAASPPVNRPVKLGQARLDLATIAGIAVALGGIIAGLSVTSRTEILAVVLGSLFVAEVSSVVLQILTFRTTGRRVFRMAPFHHHFELAGWAETTVIIRFWLLTAIACGLGVALFYGEWLGAIGA